MSYMTKAISFVENPLYKELPYSKRNWGHPWHSLCSYHGKIKPAIASILIKEFTKKGDVILDPLCGVGTIPFEAALNGRYAIGNDLSELAYNVTFAKLCPPKKSDIDRRLKTLEDIVNYNIDKIENVDIGFGLNGKIEDYFQEKTLREIIIIREYYKNLNSIDNVDAFIFSCFAHVLHGNRPYALSRNSHPLTPYYPSGPYIYKNVIEHISNKVNLSFKNLEKLDQEYKINFIQGTAYNLDYNKLINIIPNKSVDAIITSPPFSNSIKFYSQNWLRLWLAGWEKEDFHNINNEFLEIRQKNDLGVYKSFFEIGFKLLKPEGKMILHLGKSSKSDMGSELSKLCSPWFNVIYLGNESVSTLEKHGIKDKGGTSNHQYLFLQKNQ